MNFADERGGERRRKSPDETGNDLPTPGIRKKKRPSAPEFGDALRSAYQRTLNEDIPPEMLDLLGKLG